MRELLDQFVDLVFAAADEGEGEYEPLAEIPAKIGAWQFANVFGEIPAYQMRGSDGEIVGAVRPL